MSGDGDQNGSEHVDWATLPEPVRGRLVDLAAAALGELAKADLPQRLRPVARFAPAKRARVAASALLSSLSERGAFRAAVVDWARAHRPAALDLESRDAVASAAASVLLDSESAPERLRAVAERAEETSLRIERDTALARIQRLEAEIDRVRVELRAERDATRRAKAEREAELDRLRERLRERGAQLREARDAAHAARAELSDADGDTAGEVAALTARLEKERQRAELERARADRATADAEAARRSAREARRSDEVRLALLLETLEGAAAGLRAELGVGDSSGALPADTVRGSTRADWLPAGVADTTALERLLGLPKVHLIVDGYNVTKTGYPDLPLADQRDRLVRQLSALAARTSAEVTVVFDGAGVVAVPGASVRGVRVLFSDPGVLADDVIKALVAAEPAGRPLVVATSDREIVDAVRAKGAHPVASAVLLDRLVRI